MDIKAAIDKIAEVVDAVIETLEESRIAGVEQGQLFVAADFKGLVPDKDGSSVADILHQFFNQRA